MENRDRLKLMPRLNKAELAGQVLEERRQYCKELQDAKTKIESLRKLENYILLVSSIYFTGLIGYITYDAFSNQRNSLRELPVESRVYNSNSPNNIDARKVGFISEDHFPREK